METNGPKELHWESQKEPETWTSGEKQLRLELDGRRPTGELNGLQEPQQLMAQQQRQPYELHPQSHHKQQLDSLQIDQGQDDHRDISDKSAASGSGSGLAGLIGEFGLYQLSLVLFATLRFICVGLPVNFGPLVTPALNFTCELPETLTPIQLALPTNLTSSASGPPSLSVYLAGKCELELINGSSYTCQSWHYEPAAHQGYTMTQEFDLVCGRDWTRSAFSSCMSGGISLAAIFWGFYSDRYGRVPASRLCFLVSLLAGLASCVTTNMSLFYLARTVCSFADIGLVAALATIIAETLGDKWRGASLIIIYTGWSLGVMFVPFVTGYFLHFRHLMVFTLCLHLATLPWLLTVRESIRWSLVRGRFNEARADLRIICRWNGVDEDETLEKKRSQFERKFRERARIRRRRLPSSSANPLPDALLANGYKDGTDQDKQEQLDTIGLASVVQLFNTRRMAMKTLTLVGIIFTSELLYMFSIQINSDVGEDITLNYALGGLMEILATLVCIPLVTPRLQRAIALNLTNACMSAALIGLALLHNEPKLSLLPLNLTKLAVSVYSSLVYVTVTECFPTSLRQTGSGITSTLGSLGSVLAPFVRYELARLVGMTSVLLYLSVLPMVAGLAAWLVLSGHKANELPDELDELEEAEQPAARSSRPL